MSVLIGVFVGIFWVVSLIAAFAFGYGLADQKYKEIDTEQEQ